MDLNKAFKCYYIFQVNTKKWLESISEDDEYEFSEI